jgi:hypothetical protein
MPRSISTVFRPGRQIATVFVSGLLGLAALLAMVPASASADGPTVSMTGQAAASPVCQPTWRTDGTYLTERVSPWFVSRAGVNVRFKDTSGYYYARWVGSGTKCVKQRLIDRRADYYQYTRLGQTTGWIRYTDRTAGPSRGQPNFNQQNYGWDPYGHGTFKIG